MVFMLIVIGGFVPMWLPVKDVVEFFYMFPSISTASKGKPRSSMRASSLAWSMEPKAFRKSIYVRYMSLLVSHASFKAPMIICICLDVLYWGLKPSLLKCKILCYSP